MVQAVTLGSEVADSGFSLVEGGPFYRLLRAARLERVDAFSVFRPAAAVLLVGWMPLLLLSLIERMGGLPWDPMLTDPSVAARFWAAVPMLFVAESALRVRCSRALEQFGQSALAGDATPELIKRATAEALRRRDLRSVELALVIVAIAGGLVSLWGLGDVTDWIGWNTHASGLTLARAWYAMVSLPLCQFLFARWFWRWVIWSLLLIELSRARLRLAPMHPDRAGGLDMLSDPTFAFAWFAASYSAVLSSTWATELSHGTATLETVMARLVLVALITAPLAFGPMLAFWPRMLRSRWEGTRDYGLLALYYTKLFRARWVEHGPDPAVLGTSDIQSLADIQNAYRNVVDMRVTPIGPRSLITVAVGLLVPMLPLVTFKVPLNQLLIAVGKALFGGIPG
jgi:hypothetical protein